MSVSKDLTTVYDEVKHLLRTKTELRDNDKLLWLEYIEKFTSVSSAVKTGDWSLFKSSILDVNTPMFESISRARRKIQEDYPYLAGNKIKRLEIEKEVKDLVR